MLGRSLLAAASLSLAACSGTPVGDAITISCGMDDPAHAGEATYYDATGAGNCSFEASADLMVAAMNQADYADSAACGACVEVDGPAGTVTVRIVDRCPGCAAGDLDLSREAFARIADPAAGRVDVEWRYVACDVAGSVRYRFKEGSNAWWTGVQVRNHRFPIAAFEVRGADGAYRAIARQGYNYFVAESGMGEGPYTFRLTDARGQMIEDSAIRLAEGQDVAGQAQFPPCADANVARRLPVKTAKAAARPSRPAGQRVTRKHRAP